MTKKELEAKCAALKAENIQLKDQNDQLVKENEYLLAAVDAQGLLPIPESARVGTVRRHTNVQIFGNVHNFYTVGYDESDDWWFRGTPKLLRLLNAWNRLAGQRATNPPEAYTEGLVCRSFPNKRRRISCETALRIDPFAGPKSSNGTKNGDLIEFNESDEVTSQDEVKSSTIEFDVSQITPEGLTGINSVYFVHLWNSGELNGTHSIYEVDPKLSDELVVCKATGETTADRSDDKGRTKNGFMGGIIIPNNIQPIVKDKLI